MDEPTRVRQNRGAILDDAHASVRSEEITKEIVELPLRPGEQAALAEAARSIVKRISELG